MACWPGPCSEGPAARALAETAGFSVFLAGGWVGSWCSVAPPAGGSAAGAGRYAPWPSLLLSTCARTRRPGRRWRVLRPGSTQAVPSAPGEITSSPGSARGCRVVPAGCALPGCLRMSPGDGRGSGPACARRTRAGSAGARTTMEQARTDPSGAACCPRWDRATWRPAARRRKGLRLLPDPLRRAMAAGGRRPARPSERHWQLSRSRSPRGWPGEPAGMLLLVGRRCCSGC